LGFSQKLALIRLFLHSDPKTIDQFAKDWNQVEYLMKAGFIGQSAFPFGLKKV
jgi:hypothetical protein